MLELDSKDKRENIYLFKVLCDVHVCFNNFLKILHNTLAFKKIDELAKKTNQEVEVFSQQHN